MAFLDSYYQKKVNVAVRQYYLSLPGRFESDWESKVFSNPRSFNLVWRSALRRIYPSLELNDQPPPVHMRRIFDFFSGRDQAALTINQRLAVE